MTSRPRVVPDPQSCAPVTHGRDPLAGAEDGAATHSGRLGACLVRLLDGDDGEARLAAEARVLALRLDFYDQF